MMITFDIAIFIKGVITGIIFSLILLIGVAEGYRIAKEKYDKPRID